MIKKCSIIVLSLMIAMIFASACGRVQVETTKSPATSSSAETTTKSTTKVTDKVTAEATTKATETTLPTETSTEISTGRIVFNQDEPYMNVWNCYYLLSGEKAFVFDNDIRDGLLAEDEFVETELPAGTVLADVQTFRPELILYPGKTLFILPDDRCVFFEQSASDSGEPIYNGKPVNEFYTGEKSYFEYYDGTPKRVENYELLPDTPLDPSIAPQNIIVNVDWNGDGVTDIIMRECADANDTWEQTVWYTDGASGSKTDITDRFATDVSGEYPGFTNKVMLFQDEKTGRYALIDSFDLCSSDFCTFVYFYDEESIVTYTETGGIFTYEDGQMYSDNDSFIFGNCRMMRTPLIFDGTSVQPDPSASEFWWASAWEAKDNGEKIPRYFTYTMKDVTVEKQTGGGYERAVIPTGNAVFPQYYTWNDNETRDAGYVYFVLADGSEYRIAFETEADDWSCTFGGVAQEELFYCSWGD